MQEPSIFTSVFPCTCKVSQSLCAEFYYFFKRRWTIYLLFFQITPPAMYGLFKQKWSKETKSSFIYLFCACCIVSLLFLFQIWGLSLSKIKKVMSLNRVLIAIYTYQLFLMTQDASHLSRTSSRRLQNSIDNVHR